MKGAIANLACCYNCTLDLRRRLAALNGRVVPGLLVRRSKCRMNRQIVALTSDPSGLELNPVFSIDRHPGSGRPG